MKTVHAVLIGVVAWLMVVPLAAAEPKRAYPSWDQQINPAVKRFIVLAAFGGAAVLDLETGLVWEQSPDTTIREWTQALRHCYRREVGGRKGWRLPTIEELASLVDPNNPDGIPVLPPGHPFSFKDVQSLVYWSATTLADPFGFGTGSAWLVNLGDGDVTNGGKAGTFGVWCVRGGQGIDGVQ